MIVLVKVDLSPFVRATGRSLSKGRDQMGVGAGRRPYSLTETYRICQRLKSKKTSAALNHTKKESATRSGYLVQLALSTELWPAGYLSWALPVSVMQR